ncbi:hypothetical protein FS837_001019 [Tulasnella sp. UAMH 9824]|nr:hypothetical protein FS837_001019 [Tulasnella sp. UAMH 9824]
MSETWPPRQGAVSQALSTLVEGICKDNDYEIRYSGMESADTLPVDGLLTIRDELNAAKVRLNHQIDKLVAHLAYLRNLSSPVHRLPPDVWVIILQEFGPWSPKRWVNTSLFPLLLVCRTWYDTVTGSPQLWGRHGINTNMHYEIARLVIDRSRMHPISVGWYASRERDLSKMLDLAIANSTRIRSIDMIVSRRNREDPWKLLEAPTPVLETLKIRGDINPWDGGPSDSVFDKFTLSEGPPLKHLSLRAVMTPLDSPRLSNLITLRLGGLSIRNLFRQLLRTLSSSQRLEMLCISEPEHNVGQLPLQASEPILLSHLKELVLNSVPSIDSGAILASICAPSCFHVAVIDMRFSEESSAEIDGLAAAIWGPDNNPAASLLGAATSEPGRRAVKVELDPVTRAVSIASLEPLREHWDVKFYRNDTRRLIDQLGRAISQLPSPPAVELNSNSYRGEYILINLLPWSGVLESLFVVGRDACRLVLQQLSQRHIIPGTGEVQWVCRKLSSITLQYGWNEEEDTATDGRVLLSLIRQRWSGEDGLAGTVRPSSFEVHCNETGFPNLWSLKDEITQILPSFRLIGYED